MSDAPLSEDEKWKSMSIGEKFMAIFIVAVLLAVGSFIIGCVVVVLTK